MLTVLLKKGSPFREEVTKKILDIEASGLFRGKFIPMTNDILTFLSKIKRIDERDDKEIAFTLNEFLPSISFLLVMLVGSFIFFIGELIWGKVQRIIALQQRKCNAIGTINAVSAYSKGKWT